MHLRSRSAMILLLVGILTVACANRDTLTGDSSTDPTLASSNSTACANQEKNQTAALLECVTVEGVRAHQAALQAIADANGGIRAVGTPGYDASVEYIRAQLQAAGYAVTVQPFAVYQWSQLSPPVLEQVAPAPPAQISTTTVTWSGSGDVTASVTTVPNLGCNSSDFAGFPAGEIALIARGSCPFAWKVSNAMAAGAVGVVITNNSLTILNFDLGYGFNATIPVVSTTLAIGDQLRAAAGLVLRIRTNTATATTQSANLFAETNGGNPNKVVMVGAHLDGVATGPGINDNGSGSGAILETAVQMARVKPVNKVRFAWWGAEEVGLLGSRHYVESLAFAERNKIALYLNFDMIGSPNPGYFVYDDWFAAQGSSQITSVFEKFYASRGIASERTGIYGSSDHTAFLEYGIPTGGMISGAGRTKTPEQAALWGGSAGMPFDPCYHQACDTYDNVNLAALEVNADAVAHATLFFAMNTGILNGSNGQGNASMSASRAPATPHSHGDEPEVQ